MHQLATRWPKNMGHVERANQVFSIGVLSFLLLCSGQTFGDVLADSAPVEYPLPAASLFSFVDLNDPIAMERVQKSNPDHYRKVQSMLGNLVPQNNLPEGRHRAINYRPENVSVSNTMLTTFPAQRHVTFATDGAVYSGRVTLEERGGVAYPVRR